VAPALIPKQAGDRVNTDRRAAVPGARLMRAGDRPPVDVPPVAAAALRDLRRAREAARRARTTATCRLHAVLRRQARRDPGQATWRPAHRSGLAAVVWPTPAPPLVVPADVRAVTDPTARRPRLEPARHEPVHTWRLAPGLEALQARRGVPCPMAVTRVAARGALSRVENPRPRMRSLGLTPSASARGARRRQGGLTQAGTTPARRALVEGAWASRDPATGSRPRHLRRETLPTGRQDIRWQAPVRRCQRYRPRRARGTHAHPVVVAIARALAAFLGAIAQPVPVTPYIPHRDGGVERPTRFAVQRQRRSPAGVSSSPACSGATASALERGRHLTDARQVVAHPRLAAGSPVVSSGLRLCRWTACSHGHR
jgi:transposase